MLKSILRHPLAQSAAALLASALIRLVYWTSRHDWIVDPEAAPFIAGERQGIAAFWHGRLMMMPYFSPRARKVHVLISGHRDGMLIAKTVGWLGLGVITGSSSRGGATAFKTMLTKAREGDNLGITPDGPRGPARQSAPGIVRAALRTGVPIVPITYSATRHRRGSSWDRFMVPLPFGRLCFVAAAPLRVPDDAGRENGKADEEALREALDAALNRITDEADRRCGLAADAAEIGETRRTRVH